MTNGAAEVTIDRSCAPPSLSLIAQPSGLTDCHLTVQSLLVIRRTSRAARGFLALILTLGRWLHTAAPLLLAGAVVGALFGLAVGLLQPRLFAAASVVSLEPEVFRQNTVVSMQGLVNNYALQLRSEGLISRALDVANRPESAAQVRASTSVTGDPDELTISVRVVAPRPTDAVALVRALVDQFRREVEAANRRQAHENRLRVLVLEPAWSAGPVSPRFHITTLYGTSAGLLAGVAVALLRSWRRRTTFTRPLEVERFLDAPTLGAIPPSK
ncbi:MAG: hypothetical protein M5U01_32810 [Ardenticatenaceae bacterium]|nr:hypothetical protein [Ardenticatenaceae bacterium]HBY95212.1 hypothetical protein [Chloroflexota bacterium]